MKAVPSHLGTETDEADTAPEITADPVLPPLTSSGQSGETVPSALSPLVSKQCHRWQDPVTHTHGVSWATTLRETPLQTATWYVGTALSSCCSITEASRCAWREQPQQHLERTLAGVDAHHGNRLIFHSPRSPDSRWVLMTSAEARSLEFSNS